MKKWIRAHVELTDWINAHLPEAKKVLIQQIQSETSKSLTPAAKSAFDAGFLGRQMPDLSRLYDLTLLNQVLTEKGKKAIR